MFLTLCLRTGGDLCNLLRDGSLTHAVILQGKLCEELFRVAVGGIHRRHAGILLAAEAIDEGTVNKARNIALHDVVENRLHGGYKLEWRVQRT